MTYRMRAVLLLASALSSACYVGYAGGIGQATSGGESGESTGGVTDTNPGSETDGDQDSDDGDDRPSVDPAEPLDCSGDISDPGPTIVARLTRTEYINTVQDMFAVDISDVVSELPYEIREPLSTGALAQSTDFKHVSTWSDVAEFVADEVGDFADDYTSCQEFEQTCQREFVERLGTQVFRRPIRDAEVEKFLPLFDVVADEDEGFDVAAKLVLRSMLMSAPFLYHLVDERGSGARQIGPYELANRLSYLVWHSAPDSVLLQAAADGKLDTPDGREAQVRRMVGDPRFERAALSYVEDWVDLTRLERAVSSVDDSLKAKMRRETETFVSYVLVERRGGLVDLLSEETAFVDAELAELYGIDGPETAFEPVELSSEPSRRGLLTQASLLAAHGNGNRPAIVSRGLFLLRSVLCRDIPDPPTGTDTNDTQLPEDSSDREKSQERLDRPGCAGCHTAFDPLAYAFESYDGAGRFSQVDVNGNATRSDGWIPPEIGFLPESSRGQQYEYASVNGLIDHLVQLDFVGACASSELPLIFTMRRKLDETVWQDACAIDLVAKGVAAEGGSYEALLIEIARQPMFAAVRAR